MVLPVLCLSDLCLGPGLKTGSMTSVMSGDSAMRPKAGALVHTYADTYALDAWTTGDRRTMWSVDRAVAS